MAFALSAQGKWMLRSAQALPFVVSGAAHLLRTVRDESLVNLGFKHLQLSVDAPKPDFVHLRAVHQGRPLSFREAAALLQGAQVCAQVERLETATTGHFEFDPAEAFARVVSIYDIDWSNFMPYAPAVKAGFMGDGRERQEEFLREFLALYEAGTDVTAIAGAPAAVEWLKSTRCFVAQHTVVLRPAVVVPPAEPLERALHEAVLEVEAQLAALHAVLAAPRVVPKGPPVEQLYSPVAYPLREVREVLKFTSGSEPAPGLPEVLAQLQVPPPRRAFHSLMLAARGLEGTLRFEDDESALPAVAAARPAIEEAWAAMQHALEAALQSGW
jgi:hypothetical protein